MATDDGVTWMAFSTGAEQVTEEVPDMVVLPAPGLEAVMVAVPPVLEVVTQDTVARLPFTATVTTPAGLEVQDAVAVTSPT